MGKSIADLLLNTTLMGSVFTNQRLKNLSEQFGCSEDILSRFAISLSLKQGPIPRNWEPTRPTSTLTVNSGKPLRGKTLFKSDLSLFLVMLALHEPNSREDEARGLFTLHWERGVQMMADESESKDWLEYLHEKISC